MKKIIVLALLTALGWLLGPSSALAQSIEGKQIQGDGTEAQLECTAVTFTKVVTITQVSGTNAGFWIQKGNTPLHKFWKPNDAGVVGLKLQPGTYYVYPNLPPDSKQASVKLYYQ